MNDRKTLIQRARDVVSKRELNEHHYWGDDRCLTADEVALIPPDGPCCVLGALIQADPDISARYMKDIAAKNGDSINTFPFFPELARDMEATYGLDGEALQYLQDINDSAYDDRKEQILGALERLTDKTVAEIHAEDNEDCDYDS